MGRPGAVRAEVNLSEAVLLEPGEPPHELLRYDLEAFAPVSAVIDVDTTVERRGEFIPGGSFTRVMPRMRLLMDYEVAEPAGDGTVRIAANVREMQALDREGVEEAVLKEVTQRFAPVRGIREESVADARGRYVDRLPDPSELDPVRRARVEAQMNNVNETLLPLPAEPVGVGARWEVVEQVSVRGLVIKDRTVYTLVEWSGNTAVIDFEVVHDGDITGRGTMDGFHPNLVLTSNEARGQGRAKVNFSSLVPQMDVQMEVVTRTFHRVEGHGRTSTLGRMSIRPGGVSTAHGAGLTPGLAPAEE